MERQELAEIAERLKRFALELEAEREDAVSCMGETELLQLDADLTQAADALAEQERLQGAAARHDFQCPVCGAFLKRGAERCAKCGTEFDVPPVQGEEPEDDRSELTGPDDEEIARTTHSEQQAKVLRARAAALSDPDTGRPA